MRMLRKAVALLIAVGIGWWLFADTWRAHRPASGLGPLRISFWGAYEEFLMWKELGAAFTRAHPDIPIKLDYIPGRYEDKVRQQLVGHVAADVILYQDEPFFTLVDAGNFADLTGRLAAEHGDRGLRPWLEERFWPTAVESFGRPEGEGEARRWHQYALPIWGGSNLVYANEAAFAAAGIRFGELPGPEGLVRDGDGWVVDDRHWTLDEFLRIGRMLTIDENGDGFVERFGYSGGYSVYWLPFHLTLGADLLDPSRTRTVFYGPATEASLQLYQDVVWSPERRMHPRDELAGMDESTAFYTGRVAMFSTGPWAMPFLNAAKVPYRLMHTPRNPADGTRATRITWDGVAINARSRQPDNAWLFIKELCFLRERQAIVASAQRSIPALRAAKDAFIGPDDAHRVSRFVDATGDYARMQPISRWWAPMIKQWQEVMDDLRLTVPAQRLTPREAIGKYLSNAELMGRLPPLDPEAARPYIEAYRARGVE